MFVGYADDHYRDVYRFLNIHTKRIIISTDVRWQNIIWKHHKWKSIYARKQVELILDEEEKSIEHERSFGENTVKQEHFGFQVSPPDPCMLLKENELGVCIIIMYVDDMPIIGKKEQIQDFLSKIQKEFSVKMQHNLADYLGCEFHMNQERTRGWLGQLSIIKSLEQNFWG